MADVRLTLRLNEHTIDSLTQPGGLADQAAAKLAGTVRREAQLIITREKRVNHAYLQKSIRTLRQSNTDTQANYEIGSDLYYAWLQHEGWPHRIYPTSKRVLRFPQPRDRRGYRIRSGAWKQNRQYVYAQWTRGFTGIHYLTRALERLRPSDLT